MALRHAALHDRVCLEARGPDAESFLHGQLTRTVLALDSAAPLAGWADARGRVRAVFRVVRLPERWLLVAPRDGADAVLKKLGMYVLRAKVTLGQAGDVALAALLGDAGPALERRGVPSDTPPNRMVYRDGVCYVRVGPRLWHLLGPQDALASLAAETERADEAAAARAEIELGIPEIVPAVAERYVAQMLNLDVLDAISFDKGCYPGQEVIARVHNLGSVKRRARRFAASGAPPAPGRPVLAADGSEAGEVVRAAAASAGSELLAVVDLAAAGGALRCGDAALAELPLPFEVPRA